MEKMIKFNARCYALIISNQGRLLVMKELWQGVSLQKLPGGGLELGEGLIECLDREIKEEFKLWSPLDWSHFYIPTHAFSSRFKPNEQLLLNYFIASNLVNEEDWAIIDHDPNLIEMIWLPLEAKQASWFSLESDRAAFIKLVRLKTQS
tara:strand:- start:99 stop:545 length:447 start_codon:yes stop_codon:yes gene_type:complete